MPHCQYCFHVENAHEALARLHFFPYTCTYIPEPRTAAKEPKIPPALHQNSLATRNGCHAPQQPAKQPKGQDDDKLLVRPAALPQRRVATRNGDHRSSAQHSRKARTMTDSLCGPPPFPRERRHPKRGPPARKAAQKRQDDKLLVRPAALPKSSVATRNGGYRSSAQSSQRVKMTNSLCGPPPFLRERRHPKWGPPARKAAQKRQDDKLLMQPADLPKSSVATRNGGHRSSAQRTQGVRMTNPLCGPPPFPRERRHP